MKILLVVATTLEVAPALRELFGIEALESGLGRPGELIESPHVDCLVTGVGQLQCAVHLVRTLERKEHRLAVQAGIGGSFLPTLRKGQVVVVREELLPDLGAEDREGFLDLFEMGLLDRDAPPFCGGSLIAPELGLTSLVGLPRARSVTLNRVLSHEASIAWVRRRFAPDVANMEGAAFLYGCLTARVPCVTLRAISDFVGPRDKSSWDIPGAVSALHRVLTPLLDECQRAS